MVSTFEMRGSEATQRKVPLQGFRLAATEAEAAQRRHDDTRQARIMALVRRGLALAPADLDQPGRPPLEWLGWALCVATAMASVIGLALALTRL